MAKMINLKPLLCNIKFGRKLLCLLSFRGLDENPHEQKYLFFFIVTRQKVANFKLNNSLGVLFFPDEHTSFWRKKYKSKTFLTLGTIL